MSPEAKSGLRALGVIAVIAGGLGYPVLHNKAPAEGPAVSAEVWHDAIEMAHPDGDKKKRTVTPESDTSSEYYDDVYPTPEPDLLVTPKPPKQYDI